MPPELILEKRNKDWAGRFTAMASKCEVLLGTNNKKLADKLARLALREIRRIEHKFSRYRNDNLVWDINNSQGKTVKLDAETAALFTFANQLYEISDGLFDITSGVLRRVWVFDGSDRVPDPESVASILPLVGWSRVKLSETDIQLPAGMELDLGGIGKEYAVDRVLDLLNNELDAPLLVNFGGDLACNGQYYPHKIWTVGIEGRNEEVLSGRLKISAGALATSGDLRRFLKKDGRIYSHVLNPKTGWPIEGAPSAVTVAAPTCTEAGSMSTLAILQGNNAEEWLATQHVEHWVQRMKI